MQQSARTWIAAERQLFIEVLTETGNPATAADAIHKSLASAYRMRDRMPQFAAEWHQALRNAWEQVEMRMLSNLLDGDVAKIDAKVALEMLKRRPSEPPAPPMLTIDAVKLNRVRAEIRALMAPRE